MRMEQTELMRFVFTPDGFHPDASGYSEENRKWFAEGGIPVLYGVGVRFDEDPMLFFELRGVEVSRFIDVSLKDHVNTLLEHADNRTSRMMDDADIEKVFGSI